VVDSASDFQMRRYKCSYPDTGGPAGILFIRNRAGETALGFMLYVKDGEGWDDINCRAERVVIAETYVESRAFY
jgi:hypothetical protein